MALLKVMNKKFYIIKDQKVEKLPGSLLFYGELSTRFCKERIRLNTLAHLYGVRYNNDK